MKIPAHEAFVCRLLVFEITFHHTVPTDHNFTLCCSVHWDLLHAFIHNGYMFHHWKSHTLSGLCGGAASTFEFSPTGFIPDAFRDMAISFGKPITLCHVETKCFDFCESRGRGGCTCGEYLNCMIKSTPFFWLRVHNHI